jgi:hypothetical protein
MAQYWLYDGTNTLELDERIVKLSLGGNKRAFSFKNYMGANGASIRGFGEYSTKKFILTRIEKAESGDLSAWNSRRNDFMIWATKARVTDVWLYQKDGENSITMRTKVYFSKIPSDQYDHLLISKERPFELISPSGVWENTTATTDTEAITSSVEQTVSITNNGNIEAPIQCKFTPTGNETLFSCYLYNNYGFTLERSFFTAGQQIIYDTEDNVMTIAGTEVELAQYLTAGSVFNIPTGTFNLYVKCSGPGTFAYSFNQRYI